MITLLIESKDGRVTYNGKRYDKLTDREKIIFRQAVWEAKGLPTSEQPPFNSFTPVVGVVDVNNPVFDEPIPTHLL